MCLPETTKKMAQYSYQSSVQHAYYVKYIILVDWSSILWPHVHPRAIVSSKPGWAYTF